jgi:hypothetical protein
MQVTIRDAGDLKAINKALKRASDGKEIQKQLGKQLRGFIRPMVTEVKAAWLSAPSRGHASSTRARRGQPDLRKLLAKATGGQVRFTGKEAGIRVRTDGRKMPSGSKSLPTYAEGTKRPWRHTVFGDREVWVTQQSFPRFFEAVQPNEAAPRRACIEAVDAVFDQIARAR